MGVGRGLLLSFRGPGAGLADPSVKATRDDDSRDLSRLLKSMLKSSPIGPICKSVSISLGGVAVLDVLFVIALCLEGAGVNGCGGADALENLPPKENVRPAARNAPDNGGIGISYKLRECGESAVGPSVERRVDELNREPSCTAPLQPNLLAVLTGTSIMPAGGGGSAYEFLGCR